MEDKSGVTTWEGYKYPVLKELIMHSFKRDPSISVLLLGHPGIGKSTMARELAAELGLPVIELRLAQIEPSELTGMPYPNRKKKIFEWLIPDWAQIPLKNPAFIFLDEINSAVTKLHQAAAYEIVLDHRIKQHKFHPQTIVMAAGNLPEDDAMVSPMSSALSNRFCHYILKVDTIAWLEWAIKNNISPDIRAFIAGGGEDALYKKTQDITGAFPSPRSWEFASRIAHENVFKDPLSQMRKNLVAGCIGEGLATEFFAFLKGYKDIKTEDIIMRGKIPDFSGAEPSFIYSVVFNVSRWLQVHDFRDEWKHNIAQFLKAPGVNASYRVLFFRDLPMKYTKRILNYYELADVALQILKGLKSDADIED